MIAFLELSGRGNHHAPFNAMLLRTACLAYPGRAVAFWAEPSHAERVTGLLGDQKDRVACHSIQLTDHFPDKIEFVSLRRILHDFRVLWRASRSWGEDTVAIVSSASATGIVAAALLRLLAGRKGMLIQLPLHGQLNALRGGHRPRNPLYRALDLASALRFCRFPRFRYVVLEESVREQLLRIMPGLAGHVDVFPHPVNDSETAEGLAEDPVPPIRIGIVGVATRAKGFDLFLRVAQRLAAAHAGRIEFHLVGRLHPDFFGADVSCLAGGAARADLDRAQFVARVRGLHYVCLLSRGGYYDLAASGSLIDAITSLKPVIALRNALMTEMFHQHGDIGSLCEDETALIQALERIATSFDVAAYRRQVAAMEALYRSRTPAALAASYRRMVEDAT